MTTVKEMVEEYLKKNCYDGLFNTSGKCACRLDNLIPCCDGIDECRAGYEVECPGGDECENGDCEFHIVAEKPAADM